MLTPYQAQYYALQLSRRTPANSLEKFAATLVDAQVDLNPHQVEAALFAFRSPLSRGAMLADEVGLGKTIEAGLVISQKWAEQKRRMLIIAPSSLRKQWSQELADKFFLPSVVIEKKLFDQEIKKGNHNPFHQDGKIVICSYHFARSKEDHLSQTQWDLAILDEAHKLRNVYRSDNQIGTSVRASLRNVPKILLTATPLQNSLLELYGMVSIIDEQIFGDLASFRDRYGRLDDAAFAELQQRLRPVCKRTLRRDVLEYIKYTHRKPLLQTYEPYPDEQELYDLVSDYLQSENLYALPASQRSLMTLILRKLLASSSYAISGTLTRLTKKMELMLQFGGVASTNELADDYEALEDTAEEWGGEDVGPSSQFNELEAEQIRAEHHFLQRAENLALSIQRNAKGEALLKALETGFAAMAEQGANRKAIIFTESRRTQEYLQDLLQNNGYSDEVVIFNGDNNTPAAKKIYQDYLAKHRGTDRISGATSADQRAALVDHFRDTASIMVATEAAAEGINLQFCSLLVNYDLPWNPQRIEQRIGRCHRYGQKHDVVVVNFLNENNAADRRVFELLNSKFHLFSGVFGASDEVLGSIESGVDIEKRIAAIYQTCRTEEEIQAAFDTLQQEMEVQIASQINKTKQQLLDHFDAEVHEKLRISLDESRTYLNTWQNWLWQLTRFALADCATFADGGAYEFSLLRNPFHGQDIPTGRYCLGQGNSSAYQYRIGHPLAQALIGLAAAYEGHPTPDGAVHPVTLKFDYTKVPQKVSILEPLIGQAGILQLSRLSIHSFEREDYLRLFAVTDQGVILTQEQCERLFSLPAVIDEDFLARPQVQGKTLEQGFRTWKSDLLDENLARNGTFFDEEMTKLEHWADDQKNALELHLRNVEQEIKARRTTARKLVVLQEKLDEQRAIKKLETERNQLRARLFQAQDEIDERKEELLSTVEERMQQGVEEETVFLVGWELH
ncbi:SNF2-related protein [Neolewinella lacunae]|uniref:DEAD/DEAH box helicase family protein n=1 Tax=Neolewinella lacunae TaxID=1517758 RepID=A0A923PKU3_9BACT|nr:SNF2-related protein [Neolewinella lacunae]MBC6995895.1 DEAD/DEAH box helicase family protein [Neolewinella lacunae]MDN3636413.1 SNF2-related protein [Neolewinella lacunae]